MKKKPLLKPVVVPECEPQSANVDADKVEFSPQELAELFDPDNDEKSAIYFDNAGNIVGIVENSTHRWTVIISPEDLWDELQASPGKYLRACGGPGMQFGPMGLELVTASGDRLRWLTTVRCIWTLVPERQSVHLVVSTLLAAAKCGQISAQVRCDCFPSGRIPLVNTTEGGHDGGIATPARPDDQETSPVNADTSGDPSEYCQFPGESNTPISIQAAAHEASDSNPATINTTTQPYDNED